MRLEELLEGAKSVALSGHIRPDGDCVGSVMSVYQYIKKNMPEIEVKAFLETPSSVFGCIEGVKDIAICKLTSADVVRHALVQEIINAYEKADKKQESPKLSKSASGHYQRKK